MDLTGMPQFPAQPSAKLSLDQRRARRQIDRKATGYRYTRANWLNNLSAKFCEGAILSLIAFNHAERIAHFQHAHTIRQGLHERRFARRAKSLPRLRKWRSGEKFD